MISNFKKAREAKGISQKEIAISLSVSQPTVSDWESGKKIPTGKNLMRLSELLSCTTDYLLGKTNELIPNNEAYKPELTKKDRKEIKKKAEKIKEFMVAGTSVAFDGKIEDEETLELVMQALEEGLVLAKKEAKEKYTPKKYRK